MAFSAFVHHRKGCCHDIHAPRCSYIARTSAEYPVVTRLKIRRQQKQKDAILQKIPARRHQVFPDSRRFLRVLCSAESRRLDGLGPSPRRSRGGFGIAKSDHASRNKGAGLPAKSHGAGPPGETISIIQKRRRERGASGAW